MLNQALQQFEIDNEKSNYRVSRSFLRECGPEYLLIEKPSAENGGNWIVDFQNEDEEVVGFETLGEAVGACVQYMMEFETE